MGKQYFVYILASQRNGTLYVGVTSDLARRVDEHKLGVIPSFTQRYRIHQLVYYEASDEPEAAIKREKNIKAWKRAWKLRLIEETNPEWRDLSTELVF